LPKFGWGEKKKGGNYSYNLEAQKISIDDYSKMNLSIKRAGQKCPDS